MLGVNSLKILKELWSSWVHMDKNLLTCFVLERDLAPWKSFQMMGPLWGGSASYACQEKNLVEVSWWLMVWDVMLSAEELMLLNCGVGEDSCESLGLQGDPTSPFWRRSTLGFLWKDWCWSWSSSTLATSCEELTHWKRPWCWEGLGTGGEGDDPGWDGWMASLSRWTWVWVNSGRWLWTGRPGVLWFMGSQRVRLDWVTELNWTELN